MDAGVELFAPVSDKRIGIRMFLVDRHIDAFDNHPLFRVDCREESIRIGKVVMDMRDVQPVGEIHSLRVECAASDNEYFVLSGT